MIDITKVYKPEEVSDDLLNEMIDVWSVKTFGDDFAFRPYQKEAVFTTLNNWLHGKKDVICSAPTGSGKSILAIIVAGVLVEYFDMDGYILISDLSLLDQYEKDINMYCPDWAVIKGQQNYHCAENGMPYPVGNCHLAGYKRYDDIINNYNCAAHCEYLTLRSKAICSSVLVCTYSFWLIVQNTDSMEEGYNPYKKRDFTIADEAHKAVEIVQSHFSPKFCEADNIKYASLIELMQKHHTNGQILQQEYTNLRRDISMSQDKTKVLSQLKKYLTNLRKVEEQVKPIIPGKNSNVPKKQRIIYINAMRWLEDSIGRFVSFIEVIDSLGTDNLVKTVNKTSTVFNCLNDSYLMKSKFLDKCEHSLFMSATLGNIGVYAKSISLDDFAGIEIPSTFDYTKSPIYFVDGYKMSYNDKETSLPKIVRMISKILTMYSDKRGIIQTGSYELTERIFNMLSPMFGSRILMYNDSGSKQEQLDNYKYSDNLVLIGPTLLEGISLDDDLARFLIVAKVPYASLADNYTKEKMKYDPGWYNIQAAKSMLQGIGRGVRSKDDWCVSFILDGCFNNILRQAGGMFPSEFIQRIQVIPAQTLLV